jgi:predicted O-methyltransferase YrrM
MPTVQINFDVIGGESNVSIADMLGIKGLLNLDDVKVITTFAENLLMDGGKYVETGSYLGLSASIIGMVSKANLIYAHDMWDTQFAGDIFIDEVKYKDYFFKFYENVKKLGFENRIIPIRGDSKYTLGIHDDKSIDLAFIDGDHSYQGVYGDLEAILPKMKPGSVILCHDCQHLTDTWSGVCDFAKNFNLKLKFIDGTSGMGVLRC